MTSHEVGAKAAMLAGLMCAVLCVALAKPAAAASDEQSVAGDAASGQRLAEKGASGVPACFGCHGGAALQSGAFPVLQGQTTTYLAKQLTDFASGTRKSAVMQPVAAALTPRQIADLVAFYSAGAVPTVTSTPPSVEQATTALRIATSGDPATGTQACANCHGARGRGEPPSIPRIAGQSRQYLATQLVAWRSASRANDAGQQMRAAAVGLTDIEIVSLASYFAAIPASDSAR